MECFDLQQPNDGLLQFRKEMYLLYIMVCQCGGGVTVVTVEWGHCGNSRM